MWKTEAQYGEIKPIVISTKKTSIRLLFMARSINWSFINFWHRAGMAAHQKVTLTLEDACQNILILGGIGSVKQPALCNPCSCNV